MHHHHLATLKVVATCVLPFLAGFAMVAAGAWVSSRIADASPRTKAILKRCIFPFRWLIAALGTLAALLFAALDSIVTAVYADNEAAWEKFIVTMFKWPEMPAPPDPDEGSDLSL